MTIQRAGDSRKWLPRPVGAGTKAISRFNRAVTEGRSKCKLEHEEIAKVAWDYHVVGMPVCDIADKYDQDMIVLARVIRGENRTDAWSSAIIDLIANGHKCSRVESIPYRNYVPHKYRGLGRIPLAVVLRCRQMHLDGEVMTRIEDETGVPDYKLKCLFKDRTYNEEKYFPEGWDDRG